MSKTMNKVIDDQNAAIEREQSQTGLNYAECEQGRPTGNAKREEHERRVRDMYRLSIETVKNLSQALHDAMKELQGERSIGEAVTDCPLYEEMLPLSLSVGNMWLWREKNNDKYARMEWMELLKELYLRLQMLYKYGYVDNGNLSGIAWSIDKNGVFCLDLRDCAINMEYDVKDEHYPDDVRCRLFAIGLNMPLLEREDPESEESHLCGEFDEFVTFTCQFKESGECRDVYPSHYSFTQAMRNILGSLDLISKMTENKH